MNPSEKLTPQIVREILEKYGTVVTIETASEIANFMTLLADIAVTDYLKKRGLIGDNSEKSEPTNYS